MWLLKFHISVCVLCWLAIKSMKIIFRDSYARYKKSSQKSKRSDRFFVYVCPVLNVMLVLGALFMAFTPDELVDEINEVRGEE
jgi:amino acid permease